EAVFPVNITKDGDVQRSSILIWLSVARRGDREPQGVVAVVAHKEEEIAFISAGLGRECLEAREIEGWRPVDVDAQFLEHAEGRENRLCGDVRRHREGTYSHVRAAAVQEGADGKPAYRRKQHVPSGGVDANHPRAFAGDAEAVEAQQARQGE